MAIGAASQSGRPALTLGLQGNSPLIGVGSGLPLTRRPVSRGASGRAGGLLPSADTLDYLHKLTSTSVLLAALVAFLVISRGRPRAALRGLMRKHVADMP